MGLLQRLLIEMEDPQLHRYLQLLLLYRSMVTCDKHEDLLVQHELELVLSSSSQQLAQQSGFESL